jgi:hypothetical protein
LLIIACLLLIPLGLRYLTTWHMSRLRLRLAGGDEEFRQLRDRHVGVREELIDTRRRLRQYEVRKTFVAADIRAERQRLEALVATRRAERLAA